MTDLLAWILISFSTMLDNPSSIQSTQRTELELSPNVIHAWTLAGAKIRYKHIENDGSPNVTVHGVK